MSLLHLSSAASQTPPQENTAINTTLYELIEAIIDATQPGEDTLIEATVQDLVESGKLRWIRSGRHGATARYVPFSRFLNLN